MLGGNPSRHRDRASYTHDKCVVLEKRVAGVHSLKVALIAALVIQPSKEANRSRMVECCQSGSRTHHFSSPPLR